MTIIFYIVYYIYFFIFVKFLKIKILKIENIVLITAIIIFIIWVFCGDIRFTLYKNPNQEYEIKKEQIIKNLENLQNITWFLYYSPGTSRNAFAKSLNSAQDSIKLETYEYTKKEIKSIMKNLLKKWVNIKLIMENQKYQQYQNTRKQIQEYFIDYPRFEIKSDDQMWTKYVHAKFALVDSWFWIQTANLTHSSFFTNREHFFYSENPEVRQSLNTIFDKDRHWEKIELDDIHPNLVVCNINCRTIIENLLSNAKKSITIETQYIVDKNIWNILMNQSDHIQMKFLVSDTDSNDDLIDYFWPWVTRKYNKNYVHTKMILVDDEILLLWSMNLSENSLDQNRELWILITDPTIINNFKKMFENDWETTKIRP